MSAALGSRLNGRHVLAAATFAAVAVGLLTGAQAYLARLGSHETISLGYAVQNRTLAALAWVVVGTGVVSAARRWPLGSATWKRVAPAHAVGALLAGLAVNAILHTLLWSLDLDPVRGVDVPAAIVRDALDHAHLNALVYAVVLAVVAWLDRRPRAASAAPLDAPAAANGNAPPASTAGSRYAARLTARRRDTLTVVAVEDVDWIEGADDYACLHVGSRRHLTDDRLRELERMLDPACFVRVHRSALVNLSRVREVEEGRWGDAVAVLHDGTRVRVSRTRREALTSALRPSASRPRGAAPMPGGTRP